MSEKRENNMVSLVGTIASGFQYSHSVLGEGFYMTDLLVERLRGQTDRIPLLVSERILDVKDDYSGRLAAVAGQFRSYNDHEGRKSCLVLSVFVYEIVVRDVLGDGTRNNQIFLDGYLCKKPVYRRTPLGREIADLLVAVNRTCGKSDYIPCIVWGRNAGYVSETSVGERIRIWGRIQSREYTKVLGNMESEVRIAYEVSAGRVEKVEQAYQDGTGQGWRGGFICIE